nr:PTS glucose transporter subunit IIA [Paenibacillus sp. PCH8]
MRSEQGAELLVHVGINTVKLKGKYFSLHINEGDEITQGQLLLDFDIAKIQEAGFDITTPVVVTNTDAYKSVTPTQDTKTTYPNEILTLIP